MASPKHVKSEVVYEAWLKAGRDNVAASKLLGISEASVRRHVSKIKEIDRNRSAQDKELVELRKQIKKLETQVLSDSLIQNEIMGLTQKDLAPPEWLTRQKNRGNHFAGVPTFFASDWHWGERVRPAEIGGVNEYNTAIAVQRAQTFIDVGIELLTDHMTKATYDGVVLALGGDMLSGDIHDELSQTNEIESMPALLQLTEVLSDCISRLQDQFGKVFIPCVTGNHGRTSRKPRAKRRNHTNFDWLLYNFLAMQFKRNKHVTFQIPEGSDAYYRIYGTRYLMSHGDQFRGGDGMIGPIGPIFRGDKKKRSRNVEIDMNYDVMIIGHFHQYMHLSQLIVNGTLKGYDEYAFAGNFPFEVAQQALWCTHPEHGVTYRMPVYVQRALKEKGSTPWVSVQG